VNFAAPATAAGCLSCDLDVIASELRLLAAVRRTAAQVGMSAPRIGPVDELLDEWICHRRNWTPRPQ
jgi:hypothetical protein